MANLLKRFAAGELRFFDEDCILGGGRQCSSLCDTLVVPLAIATGQVQSDELSVMFDPELPMRVWAEGQNYGSTDGIDVLFIVVGILQAIVVAAAVSIVLGERGSNVRISPTAMMYVIPILIESFMLLVLGMALCQG